jgi:hypothetical protein
VFPNDDSVGVWMVEMVTFPSWISGVFFLRCAQGRSHRGSGVLGSWNYRRSLSFPVFLPIFPLFTCCAARCRAELSEPVVAVYYFARKGWRKHGCMAFFSRFRLDRCKENEFFLAVMSVCWCLAAPGCDIASGLAAVVWWRRELACGGMGAC